MDLCGWSLVDEVGYRCGLGEGRWSGCAAGFLQFRVPHLNCSGSVLVRSLLLPEISIQKSQRYGRAANLTGLAAR
jgi:hypothetical protein